MKQIRSMMITALPSSEDFSRSKKPDLLASSRDDVTIDQKGLTDEHINSREKRFFINKNQFVVSTVVTTFAFVNTTITRTVNLVSPRPNPDVQCDGSATKPCACLPAGFVVCPPAGR